jgi:hypothetical protein
LSARFPTRRRAILTALANKFKIITTANGYLSNVGATAFPNLKFWDEVEEFPAIYLSAGSEVRQHQAGGYKDRFLTVAVKAYIKHEDEPIEALERLLEDIETVVDNNGRLEYQDSSGNFQTTHDITVSSIDTDEGLLSPLGVGEMILQVRY